MFLLKNQLKKSDRISIENQKNRDLFLKLCFMYFLNHILKVLGIDEEIVDVLPTELITWTKNDMLKIFDDLHDFRVLTQSGKIIIFEFKKNSIRTQDLEQMYNYFWHTYCKEKTDVMAIIIVISKEGKIMEYTKQDFTYHPRIIKTKKINKQEDLKTIRNKFENNKLLSEMECSLLITLPLFDLKESESEIVEEMCENIEKKSHCIPEDKLEDIIMGMYLNILEYVELEKQEELKEKIDMAARTEGIFAKMKREAKNDGINEGINKGERNIILELLKTNTIEEVSLMLHKEVSEIQKILGIA